MFFLWVSDNSHFSLTVKCSQSNYMCMYIMQLSNYMYVRMYSDTGKLQPGSAQAFQFPVSVKEYEEHIGTQGTLLATFLVYVDSHDESWISRIPVNLKLPSVTVNIDKKGVCLSMVVESNVN